MALIKSLSKIFLLGSVFISPGEAAPHPKLVKRRTPLADANIGEICKIHIDWTAFGDYHSRPYGVWRDEIELEVYRGVYPDITIDDLISDPFQRVGLTRTTCNGYDQEWCFQSVPGLPIIRASPQHLFRRTSPSDRDYIQFYVGPPEDVSVAFHTDHNGNPDDDYWDPNFFPHCRDVSQLPGFEFKGRFDTWINGLKYDDGNATSFDCYFECPMYIDPTPDENLASSFSTFFKA
ncbi:hypothetical protein H072_1594 [Dactylellina haptotyla CBS 200.50]|uniref:Uncharacterized protein n=1 Tax=Dactylellina haptotyla (strain CBS 200.50) TaxID=1284197 RepID=S8AN78_DACHA|nr:hypothetical protein H072_1594 [Dactylellina haptotyla CBS 200.50]